MRGTVDQMRRSGARQEDLILLSSIILLRTGELQQAQQQLAGAPEGPQKAYGLALLAIVQGNHEEAKKQLAQVIAGWEPVLRSYARTLQGAYDEYALFPQSPALHLTTLLARALAQVQECELALPLLSQVTNQQNDYRDAWIVQGYCELTTNRFPESLSSFEHAYTIDPVKPEIQYFLARAYSAISDHGNAITFLQYALQNGFEPAAEARRLLAQEALQKGDTNLALEQFDLLTQQDDATLETYSSYVTTAIASNHKEEAYVKASEAVKKWPKEAVAFDLLGWSAEQTGRKEEAKTNLTKALQLDPGLSSAKEHLSKL